MRKYSLLITIFYFLAISAAYSQSAFVDSLKLLEDRVISDEFKPSDTTSILGHLNRLELSKEIEDCDNWYLFQRVKGLLYFNIDLDNDSEELFEKYHNLYIEHNKSVAEKVEACFGSDHENLARTFYNIGGGYYNLWEDDKAIAFYEKVLEVDHLNKNPSDKVCSRILFIGEFLSEIGDYDKALSFYQVALNKLPKKNPLQIKYLILRSQARAYFNKLEFNKSIDKSIECISLAKEIYPNFDIIETSWDYEDLATNYLKLNLFDKAEKNILKAINISTNNFESRRNTLQRQKLKLVAIYSDQGRFKEVDDFYNTSINAYNNNLTKEDLYYLAYTHQLKGENLDSWGKFNLAAKEYHNSMKYMSSNLPDDFLSNPIIKGESFLYEDRLRTVFKQKGRSLYMNFKESGDQKYLEASIETLKKLDSIISQSLLKNWQEGSHLVELQKSKEGYQTGVEASLSLYQLTQERSHLESAYQFASKFKSRLLTKGINLKDKENSVLTDVQKQNVDSIRSKISEMRNKIQIASLQKDTLSQRNLYEEIIGYEEELKQFQKINNIENVLTEDDVRGAYSIVEIQNQLEKSQAILEFHSSDSLLYSFLITKDDLDFHVDAIDSKRILDIYGSITEGNRLNQEKFEKIFFSTLSKMETGEVTNLIIIPDGDLLQFPFEVLDYNNKLLLESYNVSYEYSSSFLFKNRSFSTNKRLTAFASDYNSSTFDILHDNTNYSSEGIHLSVLKNTIEEVEIADALLDGTVFKNEDATKENFEANSNKNNILHLALHGVINNEIPDQSALVFSSSQGDHLLTASEIYNMEINNDLTILSACNTGVGPVRVGDGVRSMARSFIHAGSESVLTSLWEISDATTKAILKNFYNYLNEGKSKAEALKLAKLEYMENASPTHQHPKYWAHLVLVGDPGPISFKSKTNWKLYGAGGLFVLIFLLGLAAKARAKS